MSVSKHVKRASYAAIWQPVFGAYVVHAYAQRAMDPSCPNRAYQDELRGIIKAAIRVADHALDAYTTLDASDES